MKKWMWVIVAIVIIGAAAGIIALTQSNDDTKTSSTTTKSSKAKTSYVVKEACDVLTLVDAQKLYPDAVAGANVSDTSTDSVNVSNCVYSSASASATVSVLARSAKDVSGANTNTAQFDGKTGQNVSGYGDAAYWDPAYGQLNILAHNNWYILSAGPLNPASHTLDQAKQLADIVVSKL